MHRSFDKIRQFLPVSVVALSLGACAATSPSSQTQQVSVDSMIRVADLTRGSGDLVNAVGLYQRAHELDPQDVRPLLALGQIFAQLGSPASAAEAFRAAILIEPDNVDARRGLAMTLIAVGQPGQAIAELERALDMSKDYRLYNSLGVAYDMLGDQASAQTYYKTGLELSPGNLQIINNLGLSLVLEGRYPEAIALLEPAAGDPAATPRLRQNLALAVGLAGDRTRARELAERDVDHATAEKNLSYFDVLKGLDDERTMAAALGAHLIGAVTTNQILAPQLVPAAPAMPVAVSTPVEPAAPIEQGSVEPVAPAGTVIEAPLAPIVAPNPHLGAPQASTDEQPVTEPRDGSSKIEAVTPITAPPETNESSTEPAHQILQRNAAELDTELLRGHTVRPAFGVTRTEVAALPPVATEPLHRTMASIYLVEPVRGTLAQPAMEFEVAALPFITAAPIYEMRTSIYLADARTIDLADASTVELADAGGLDPQ